MLSARLKRKTEVYMSYVCNEFLQSIKRKKNVYREKHPEFLTIQKDGKEIMVLLKIVVETF